MITGRSRLRAAIAVVAALVGLGVALAIRPGDGGRAAEAFVLFLGAVGVWLLTEATSRAFPGPTRSRVVAPRAPRTPPVARVPDLARLERELEMSMQSAFDTHYRLRPLLRELAAARLARQAVDLDRDGSRAEELLGPDAWQLVRPDAQRPSDHHAPGVRLGTVERAIDALETLGK